VSFALVARSRPARETPLKLACADGSFPLVRPYEKVLQLITLLELEAVDVVVAERAHLRLADVRADAAGVRGCRA